MNLARASISKRLSLYLLGFGFIAFACSSFYAFNVSRQYAIDLIKQRVLDYVQALGRQIDSEIKTVETTVEGIATSVSIFHPDKKKCSKLLKANLRTNPKIYALGIGFAPNAYGTDDNYRVRHVWREGVMVKESIYGSDAYDYENRPWYILARDKMVGSWTGVYANKGDNTKGDEKEYVISYSSPIQENGNFAGAVMADLQTASLTDFARNSDNDTSGFVFIVERVEGKYILHKDSQIVSSGKSLSDLAQQTSDPQRFVVSRAIMDGLAGQSFMKSLDGQEEYLVCYAPLQEVNWTVGVIVPRGEILGGINQIALQILLIAVLAFGCFWLLIRRVCRSIVRPLEQLDVAAGEIAQGNLSVNPPALTHEDEVGRLCESVRQMAGGLAFLVREVQKITIHLATTTAQISASSSSQEEVVLGFEQEFSQAAAAVAEISASAKELARTMDEVQQTSMRAAGRAGQGKAGISTMEQTMHELRDSTSSMAGKLELVRQNAENIDGVVSAITDLAEQTNLLSLNASVEAEKAGEYGRGFTVVAREIRRLSDKTAVATLEISEIVGRMQESVESGVAELQLFSEAVSRSAERASGIGAQMTELIQDVTSLTPKVRAVNDGMQAQSTGAGEISQVMKRLKSAALQISEDMNHFKQSTGQLRASADSLKEKTSRFKT